MLKDTPQTSLIKKLTTALYGYENLGVETVFHAFDQGNVRLSGTHVAFVTRLDEEIQNPYARDIQHGWGYSEEQAIENLLTKLRKNLEDEINSYSLEVNNTNKKLQELLELQKETRETL